jgi:predicted DNA-binding transcriptional regulator YafY
VRLSSRKDVGDGPKDRKRPQMNEHKYQSLNKALTLFDTLQAREFISGSELAAALETDRRTVQAYVATLKKFDWPIESSRKGYRLSELGASARLNERELLFLAILLAQGTSVLPAHELKTLSSKITSLLSRRAQSQVQELNDRVSAVPTTANDIDVLVAVGRCLSDPNLQLVVDYQKTRDSPVERRNILPLKLRYQDESCYVDSWDLDKKGSRSYRLDRFVRVQMLRQDAPIPRPPKSVTETHKWDFGSDEPLTVTLHLAPRLASWLKENPEHHSQDIQATNGSTLVHYTIKRLDLFVDWFMSLRGAQAIAPPELVQMAKERAQTIAESGGTLGLEWE